VYFEVKDTGRGIPLSRQHNIFQSFVQADNSIKRAFGGSGLGLSIANELLKLSGGVLTFTSLEGKGSTFTFTLHFAIPDIGTVKSDIKHTSDIVTPGFNASILIVEDYLPNQLLVEEHVKSIGCNVTLAVNGEEAVNCVRNGKFHLILMDIQMPVMDGCSASREIRKMENGVNVPIIGLTANAYAEDMKEYYMSGINEIITKPVKKRILINCINKWLKTGQVMIGLENNPSEDTGIDKLLNFKAFVYELEGNTAMAKEIVESFISELDIQFENISEAYTAGNWKILHREAHSISGGAKNIMAGGLSASASLLEAASKGDKPEVQPELLDDLKKSIEELKVHFKTICETS